MHNAKAADPAVALVPEVTTTTRSSRQPRCRVYFVNRYFYPDESATAQLLADLAFALTVRGFEIHIICSRQLYDAPEVSLPPEEMVRGVWVHRVWTTRFGRRRLLGRASDYVSFYVSCMTALVRRLRSADIVVAKTDPPLISMVAAVAARLKRAILVNWLQDIFPEVASELGANPLPAGLTGLLRRLRNASLRAAAANVVLGTRMREYLHAQGVPAASIQVIENWAASESSGPPATCESALRVRLGLQGKFVIGYSGNLGRAHEYATLLGAAEYLRNDERVAFLMIGGGVNMEALKAAVDERQLPNVTFLPYQPRETLGDSLAAADAHMACLIPALEGLIVPSKFYGILAAARPVIFIGDRDGELARVIRASRCGWVVETGQSAELVEAIRYLQANGKEREEMGLSSRRLLLEQYSASRAQASWITLLLGIQRPLPAGAAEPPER